LQEASQILRCALAAVSLLPSTFRFFQLPPFPLSAL
jgi:hypothetical protein